MGLPYRTVGRYLRIFEGDSAGGDELLIREHEVQGAEVVVSWGSDYGSGMDVFEITQDQLNSILSDNPPFTDSYTARLWLEANARQYEEHKP